MPDPRPRADTAAAALAGPVVAVLSPAFGGAYFGALLGGIGARLAAAGGRLVAVQTLDAGTRDRDVSRPPAFTCPVAWDRVDAVVTILNAVPLAYVQGLREAGKPVVMISDSVDGFDCPVLLPDNAGGTQAALAHLLQHGHTRIAFVGHPVNRDIQERYEAYRATMSEYGFGADEQLFLDSGDNQEAGGRNAAAALLAAGMPCTAAVTGNDLNAMGLMAGLQEAGLDIPGDLAVIGFDDAPEAMFQEPGLASVRQPLPATGARAVEVVLDLLAGATPDGVQLMPTQLIPRASCGCSSPLLLTPPRLAVSEQPVVSIAGLTQRLAAAHPHRSPATVTAAAAALAEAVHAELTAAAARPTFGDLAGIRRTLGDYLGTYLYPEAIVEVLRIVRAYGRHVAAAVAAHDHGNAAAVRVHERVQDLTVEIFLAQTRDHFRTGTKMRATAATQYAVSTGLLRAHANDPQQLAWMDPTPITAAALGLWHPPTDRDTLRLAGTYPPAPLQETAGAGEAVPVASFPPADLIEQAAPPDRVVFITPLSIDEIDWGFLATLAPLDPGPVNGREEINQYAAMLTFALEYQHLLYSLREQERQLAQANRLEAIGQLAAGIAHEINTPIQFVSDNTRFLADSFSATFPGLVEIAQLLTDHPDLAGQGPLQRIADLVEGFDLDFMGAEVPAAFEQSLEGLRRVADIVRAMKDFSHPGSERAPVDLNRAITSTVAVSRNEWKYVARIETDLDADLGDVPCYEGEIKQVILNLIVNAAHALADQQGPDHDPTKGLITITTRRGDDIVTIDVADNGPGMPEDVQRRIFEPFFTTKPVGQGTGQGLSLAHATITKKHGGTITVTTSPGEGATFHITLPQRPPT